MTQSSIPYDKMAPLSLAVRLKMKLRATRDHLIDRNRGIPIDLDEALEMVEALEERLT